MFDIDWRGLILPVSYVLVLGGTFITFSTVYRKRKAAQSANLEPWFGPHLQRNIYLSLLHMEPEEGEKSKKSVKVPDSVLRAALLRRAVEDIHRIIQIRTGKQACSSLLQRGSVGDDLWQRCIRAEKEMEEELRDVVMEANALVPNWGQIIFQTANAIAGNAALRTKLEGIQGTADYEKAWWARRRETIEQGLLEELAADEKPEKKKSEKKPAATTAASKASKAATVSDEDAVLVDSRPATPNNAQRQGTPATGGGKKKRGKK